MNNYQYEGQPYVESYGITTGNLTPRETDLNRDTVYPDMGMKSGITSPSTAPDLTYNYPTPNIPNTVEDNHHMSHSATRHRSCAYSFRSWFPDGIACKLPAVAWD